MANLMDKNMEDYMDLGCVYVGGLGLGLRGVGFRVCARELNH